MTVTSLNKGLYTLFIICYTDIVANDTSYIKEASDCMSEKEMIKVSIEEFSRVQDYMMDTDRESVAYKKMRRRYVELKVILTSAGVNFAELDMIKE